MAIEAMPEFVVYKQSYPDRPVGLAYASTAKEADAEVVRQEARLGSHRVSGPYVGYCSLSDFKERGGVLAPRGCPSI
jgi:hypothetical protein